MKNEGEVQKLITPYIKINDAKSIETAKKNICHFGTGATQI